jgi:hypothetical protein
MSHSPTRPGASASGGQKGARESARTRPEGEVGRERWEELHRTWVDFHEGVREGDEIRYQREYLIHAGSVPRGLPGACLCS